MAASCGDLASSYLLFLCSCGFSLKGLDELSGNVASVF